MSHQFQTPVTAYAHGPVVAIPTDLPLSRAYGMLEERGISALPVVDGSGKPQGVISRTDLLRLGRAMRAEHTRRSVLELPEQTVGSVMTGGLVTVPRETSVAKAAEIMVEKRIHRVYVEHNGKVDQVFGTREAMNAVWESRLATPIGEVMSPKAFSVAMDAPMSLAVDRLSAAHAQGLVVVDAEGWPVGVFTQREALTHAHLPETAAVEDAMSFAMLCLHASTPIYRAAAQASQTRSRRVLVVEDKKVIGVVTGLDFVRLARSHAH